MNIFNKIKDKIEHFLYDEIHEEIESWIYEFLGPSIIIRDGNKQVKKITKETNLYIQTGVQPLLRQIYLRGNCKQFAYLLLRTFYRYNPELYKINSNDSYHYVVKIYNRFYDVDCPYTKDIIDKMDNPDIKLILKIKRKGKKIVWVDKEDDDINKCHFTYTNIIKTFVPLFGHVPFCDLHWEELDTDHPKLIGVNQTNIDYINYIFKNISDIGNFEEHIKTLNKKCSVSTRKLFFNSRNINFI